VTFEEEAKYWKRRWQEGEWACGEIAGKVEKSYRGVYEKEVEEKVDRRMKQGEPRGKDKGCRRARPPLRHSIGYTDRGGWEERKGEEEEGDREGSQG